MPLNSLILPFFLSFPLSLILLAHLPSLFLCSLSCNPVFLSSHSLSAFLSISPRSFMEISFVFSDLVVHNPATVSSLHIFAKSDGEGIVCRRHSPLMLREKDEEEKKVTCGRWKRDFKYSVFKFYCCFLSLSLRFAICAISDLQTLITSFGE